MRCLTLASMLLLLGACYVPPPDAGLNPNPPPPPLLSEARPPPPLSEDEQIFQPGHWDWDGHGGYAWRGGRWVPRAGHGSQWLEGYWAFNGAWTWVPAHWV